MFRRQWNLSVNSVFWQNSAEHAPQMRHQKKQAYTSEQMSWPQSLSQVPWNLLPMFMRDTVIVTWVEALHIQRHEPTTTISSGVELIIVTSGYLSYHQQALRPPNHLFLILHISSVPPEKV